MPEELKTLYVKITARKDGRSHSYAEEVDLDDEREYWTEVTTNGANPHLEGQTFEDHHKPVKFPIKKMGDFNGKHFVFGFLEGLWQSDHCPTFLREADDMVVEVFWNAGL